MRGGKTGIIGFGTTVVLLIAVLTCCSACAGGAGEARDDGASASAQPGVAQRSDSPESDSAARLDDAAPEGDAARRGELSMSIDGRPVNVTWLDNEAVAALKELVRETPLTVRMTKYGGFEQVGALGAELPSSDVQTTTSPGDVVLYNGNAIVVFYGSNTWAYTRLGTIGDMTASEVEGLLANEDVEMTLALAGA